MNGAATRPGRRSDPAAATKCAGIRATARRARSQSPQRLWPGAGWDEARAASDQGWGSGLENLKSTLETGVDLRLARQPFLGINPDQLTPERAAKEGIAAEAGIYVLATVEGSGAKATGLGKGDVLVSLGGQETPGFAELGSALRTHQAGDVVDVDLVRGQAREMVQVMLGSRP